MDHKIPDNHSGQDRAAWGDGRIVYAAHADRVQQLIANGWPLKKIYRELESQLTGLSYQQFTYHVRRQAKQGASTPLGRASQAPVIISRDSVPTKGAEDETPKTIVRPVTTTRFKPGPRIPDPSQLY